MTVAVAPGTTAPCGSWTVPEIDPVTVWAADPGGNMTAAARHKRSIRKTLVRNFNIDRPPENAG